MLTKKRNRKRIPTKRYGPRGERGLGPEREETDWAAGWAAVVEKKKEKMGQKKEEAREMGRGFCLKEKDKGEFIK
jgi:hypothetical protein